MGLFRHAGGGRAHGCGRPGAPPETVPRGQVSRKHQDNREFAGGFREVGWDHHGTTLAPFDAL